jgi:HPt (histidine-containing phosphotransfer) domain-containing protein
MEGFPLLAHSVLQGLREALPVDVPEGYLHQVSENLIADALELVAMAGDSAWEDLVLQAHRLAETLASFGCEALSDALRQVEADLRATPRCPPAAESLARIVSLAKATAAALETVSANT